VTRTTLSRSKGKVILLLMSEIANMCHLANKCKYIVNLQGAEAIVSPCYEQHGPSCKVGREGSIFSG